MMDLKITLTTTLKDSNWNFTKKLNNGEFDDEAKRKIIAMLKKANLFLSINKSAVELRPDHISKNEKCSKSGCNEPVYEFGMCFKHYCISEEREL